MTLCPDYATLVRFLRHQMSEEENQGVDAHIERCPNCEEKLVQLADGPNGLPRAVLFGSSPGESSGSEGGFHLPGYEVLEPLDKGGMGAVFRVRDLALKRELAVKILR